MKKNKMLYVTALITAAFLTGCSNNKTTLDDSTISISSRYVFDRKNEPTLMDGALSMDQDVKIDLGEEVEYDHILDTSIISSEDKIKILSSNPEAYIYDKEYLKLIDDDTITNREESNTKTMSMGTFSEYQFYYVPEQLRKQLSPYDYSNNIGYTINCKKYLSENGTLYYKINEKLDLNDVRLTIFGSTELDKYIETESLYQYNGQHGNGSFTLMSFKQTGLLSDSEEIVEKNFNCDNELITPIEELKNKEGNNEGRTK